MKVVINRCFGGFGLSNAAYEKLIEWGVPLRDYVEQTRGPDGRYLPQPANERRCIFKRLGTGPFASIGSLMGTEYWDTWTNDTENRHDPLIVRLVEELGDAANGRCARLALVEIPDGVDYRIEEYDGNEHVAEAHRTWT